MFAASHGIIQDPDNRLESCVESGFYTKNLIQSWIKGKLSDSVMEQLNSLDWSSYTKLNEALILYSDDPVWERIREEEHIQIPFEGFGALLSLTHGYVVERIRGRALLVNQRKLLDFKVGDYASSLEEVLGARYTDTIRIDLRQVAGEAAASLPLPELSRLTAWLTGKEIEDCTITLSRNQVDIEQALVRFLQEKGEPMSRQELEERFQKEYPDIKVSVHTLHRYLMGNPRFIVRRYSGVYGLCEWKDTFVCSMGDLVERILKEAGAPMEIDELHKLVLEEFPDTSRRSMEGNLRLDTRKRFVKLPGKRIGLSKENP